MYFENQIKTLLELERWNWNVNTYTQWDSGSKWLTVGVWNVEYNKFDTIHGSRGDRGDLPYTTERSNFQTKNISFTEIHTVCLTYTASIFIPITT